MRRNGTGEDCCFPSSYRGKPLFGARTRSKEDRHETDRRIATGMVVRDARDGGPGQWQPATRGWAVSRQVGVRPGAPVLAAAWVRDVAAVLPGRTPGPRKQVATLCRELATLGHFVPRDSKGRCRGLADYVRGRRPQGGRPPPQHADVDYLRGN